MTTGAADATAWPPDSETKSMRIVLTFLLGLSLITASLAPASAQSAAEEPENAKQFLSALADNAFSVWQDPSLTEAEREKKFQSLLLEGFHVDYIARLVLGRYTRQASDEQFRRYLDVFPQYTVEVISNRLGEYGNEKVTINETAPAGPRGDLYIRSTIVRPDAEDVLADWRVRKVGDEFKIIDVKLEGISMVRTQREDFQQKISQDGIDGLIDYLSDQAGVTEAASGNGAQKTSQASN
ncbi:hypothetical protein CCR80_05960 [Rhodothalassium salexigens]|nr:hypothetical protein [Rhodothalassium salexigens]